MAYGDVRGFVYRVVDIFPGPLKTPARWVADRIFGVWDDISTVLTQIKPAFAFFHDKFWWLLAQLNVGITEAARTLRWIVVEAIPTWARWARDVAVSVTASAINTLQDWTSRALDVWRRALNASIDAVLSFADDVFRWTGDRLREVWNTLSVIRDRVVALLSSPEVFVEWVFAALWRRFWTFANDHAESIAAAAWMRRDTLIAQAMRRLENWLMRLL